MPYGRQGGALVVQRNVDRMTTRHALYAAVCDIEEFVRVVRTVTASADYAWCDHVELGAVVYDSAKLRDGVADPTTAVAIQRELAEVLLNGPGVVVLKGAFEASVVDTVTEEFFAEIAFQHATNMASGDHYAKPGANDRVWNALEKLAVRAPEAFVDYYANDMVALVAGAWLGPNYQVSSQVNCVNPGGEAQRPHRDFHLGFMTEEEALQYPAHVHALSAALTLQGAVAHCDMPVETGPTLYLPHSQKYLPGYVAWRRPEFIDYFEVHHMQLPLAKGDAVFFNPALFHAAGTNRTTDVRRIANLLQISSSMGRLMESVDSPPAARPDLLPHSSPTSSPPPPRATRFPPTLIVIPRSEASLPRPRPTPCTKRSPRVGPRPSSPTRFPTIPSVAELPNPQQPRSPDFSPEGFTTSPRRDGGLRLPRRWRSGNRGCRNRR
jgi:ectoine hydroxylase-related dioxygenase (phytanoyl-CoA dioxygenase family)